MSHLKQNSRFYTVAQNQPHIASSGCGKSLGRDYDTLPQFLSTVKYKQTSCAYKYNYVENFFTG